MAGIEELQSTPGLVTNKIKRLIGDSNPHQWTKFREVFERTASFWGQGRFNPDIRDLGIYIILFLFLSFFSHVFVANHKCVFTLF